MEIFIPDKIKNADVDNSLNMFYCVRTIEIAVNGKRFKNCLFHQFRHFLIQINHYIHFKKVKISHFDLSLRF